MEQTSIYNLNQWVEEDRIQREDFNADNAKIEAAILAAVTAANAANDAATAAQNTAHVATGSYTGNGEANRIIPLPFTPKVLILLGYSGSTGMVSFVTSEGEFSISPDGGNFSNYVKFTGTGFYANVSNWHNTKGAQERYIALQ